MLRTNLSTRPFYNVRAVRALLGLAALLVAGFTLFNVVQLVRLSATQRTLSADAVRAETDAARLRADAVRLRGQIDPRELALVSADAREANAIIDRRTFSWTALFVQFEESLPPDVRITAVQPRREQDGIVFGEHRRPGAPRRRRRGVHRGARGADAVPRRAAGGRTDERGRAHRGCPRRPLPPGRPNAAASDATASAAGKQASR